MNIEKDIERLQRQKKEIEQVFLKEILSDKIQENALHLETIIQKIEEKENRWFELSDKMGI